jgi:hypothetical protein
VKPLDAFLLFAGTFLIVANIWIIGRLIDAGFTFL